MNEIFSTGTNSGLFHGVLPGLVWLLEWVSSVIDLLAIAVMLVGTARFLARFVAAEFRRVESERARTLNHGRVELGRYILSGLELFIVSDIIHAALTLLLGDLIFLAVLVAIRSAISFFLDREIREIREDPER